MYMRGFAGDENAIHLIRRFVMSYVRAGIVLLMVVSAAWLGGCNQSESGSGAGGKEPIIVGEYGSMTGNENYFGDTTHKGIMIAVDEQNAAGGIKGRKISLVLEDDRSNSAEASTVVEKLITQEKAVAILGEVASGNSIAGAKQCSRYGVPMISPSSTNPVVTQTGDGQPAAMIFRVCFLDPFQGAAMAKFAYDKLGARKAAVLYDKSQPYSDGLRQAFVKAFKGFGGTITTEQAYSAGNQNYKPQLTTIRETAPDVIFVPAYYQAVGPIAEQARKELGMGAIPLLGGDGWESPQLLEDSGEWLEGCYFSNHAAPDEDRAAVKGFVGKFKAKYGQEPSGLAALGYDAAKILFAAMERAPSLSGKDLAAAIAATKDYQGVTGQITINPRHDADKSLVIVKITGKHAHYDGTVTPDLQFKK
jgi:branched-chain amino acid transport system substrate-binding protein